MPRRFESQPDEIFDLKHSHHYSLPFDIAIDATIERKY